MSMLMGLSGQGMGGPAPAAAPMPMNNAATPVGKIAAQGMPQQDQNADIKAMIMKILAERGQQGGIGAPPPVSPDSLKAPGAGAGVEKGMLPPVGAS